MPHAACTTRFQTKSEQFPIWWIFPMYNGCMRCVDVQRQKNGNLLNAWLTAKRVLLPKPFPCQWTVSRVVIQRTHTLRLHLMAYALRIEHTMRITHTERNPKHRGMHIFQFRIGQPNEMHIVISYVAWIEIVKSPNGANDLILIGISVFITILISNWMWHLRRNVCETLLIAISSLRDVSHWPIR